MQKNDVTETKDKLRNAIRAFRKALPEGAKAASDEAICGKLLDCFDKGRFKGPFAVYLATKREIDLSRFISRLLSQGCTVTTPRWNGETYRLSRLKSLNEEDLRSGPMGIREPREDDSYPSRSVNTWIVPGLAFTRDGKRIGYGGGWYDRLMAEKGSDAVSVGVAMSFQIADDFPLQSHDITVDEVIVDTD